MKSRFVMSLCLLFILNFIICTFVSMHNSPSKLILASEMSKSELMYNTISCILGILSFINILYVAFTNPDND